jgi:hypothetical protein
MTYPNTKMFMQHELDEQTDPRCNARSATQMATVRSSGLFKEQLKVKQCTNFQDLT